MHVRVLNTASASQHMLTPDQASQALLATQAPAPAPWPPQLPGHSTCTSGDTLQQHGTSQQKPHTAPHDMSSSTSYTMRVHYKHATIIKVCSVYEEHASHTRVCQCPVGVCAYLLCLQYLQAHFVYMRLILSFVCVECDCTCMQTCI